ncbi:hypothetical protein Taro_030669 [Colocasia esculenta]|uniref:Leucine-rich repeat-containing N-terminal plant-type domain-containing protein n=1 Tax=Colocasia esculenta TaxID=4460 RepID=A0A843VGW8_COLES|nr:hypothetical protein [Colocasia esculenta]
MRSVGFRLLLFPSVLWGLLFLPSSGSLIDDEGNGVLGCQVSGFLLLFWVYQSFGWLCCIRFCFPLCYALHSGPRFGKHFCEMGPWSLAALALQAIKKAILEDPLSVLSDWNMNDNDIDPCGWSGVVCSTARDRVLTLNLSHASLKGFLAPEIGSLTSLEELIINDNLFFGTIPSQIGMLKNLTLLDLSTNRLVGPIPAEIGGLDSVNKM